MLIDGQKKNKKKKITASICHGDHVRPKYVNIKV